MANAVGKHLRRYEHLQWKMKAEVASAVSLKKLLRLGRLLGSTARTQSANLNSMLELEQRTFYLQIIWWNKYHFHLTVIYTSWEKVGHSMTKTVFVNTITHCLLEWQITALSCRTDALYTGNMRESLRRSMEQITTVNYCKHKKW